MRTLGFSIASKRAQDHRIRSPYDQVMLVSVGCCWLSWVPRGHGVLTPWARGPVPTGPVPCARDPVGTGSQPPWARGVQKLPVGPQRLVLGCGYLRAPFLPPVWGLFSPLLNIILSLSLPLPNLYLPSM